VAAQGVRKKFRFKNEPMSLDGSIIDLSASMFDWAKYKRTKGAIKLHLVPDHNGYLPSFAVVTEGKHGEAAVARGRRLEPGTILVTGRGDNDYEFAEMTGEAVESSHSKPRDDGHETITWSESVGQHPGETLRRAGQDRAATGSALSPGRGQACPSGSTGDVRWNAYFGRECFSRHIGSAD
jgi:hypothetical protein